MSLSSDDKEKLAEIYNELSGGRSDGIGARELAEAVQNANVTFGGMSLQAATAALMRQGDANGDGKIGQEEFLDAMQYDQNANGTKTAGFRQFISHVASTVSPSRKEMKGAKTICWPPPIFIILITIAQISVYAYYANIAECSNVQECPPSFGTPLAFRMCCRHQAWRFISYSFLHASLSHIGFNCVIQLIIGIPLEMKNGSSRMFVLYLMGVIAGALGSSVFDPDSNVVGASGAVYTVMGAWTAELIQNWDTMRYKWVQLLTTLTLTGLDLGSQIYKRYSDTESTVSFAGHFVGFVAGITFGCYILKNVESRKGELYIRWGSISVFVTGLFFAIFWNVFFTYDPKGLCESESTAKCDGDYLVAADIASTPAPGRF